MTHLGDWRRIVGAAPILALALVTAACGATPNTETSGSDDGDSHSDERSDTTEVTTTVSTTSTTITSETVTSSDPNPSSDEAGTSEVEDRLTNRFPATAVIGEPLGDTSWIVTGVYGESDSIEPNPTGCPNLDSLFALAEWPSIGAELAARDQEGAGVLTVRIVTPDEAAAIVNDIAEVPTACARTSSEGGEVTFEALPSAEHIGFSLTTGDAPPVSVVVLVNGDSFATLEVGGNQLPWSEIKALVDHLTIQLADG